MDDCEEYDCGDDDPCGVCLACRECAALERSREAATRGGIAAWAMTALGFTESELMGDDYETAGDDYARHVIEEG